MARSAPGPAAEQRVAQIPVLWPRYIDGRVRMVPIHPDRIPVGWQSIQAHVPMRLASCEEADCPMFLNGWTEVITGSGNHQVREGQVSRDEAAQVFGYYGPQSVPPAVLHHPPGTPCPGTPANQEPGELFNINVHKIPSGIPPLYTVNGRPVLWTEFEDKLGGGVHRIKQITREGRY